MFAPERILDRGRMLLGMLIVVPLGVLGPALGGPAKQSAPAWTVAPTAPNPIAAAPTPRDVLANLTNPTVASGTDSVQSKGQTSPSTSALPSAATPPTGAGEVGSETDDGQEDTGFELPGTAPDAGLAATLRESQSRFAPATPAAPAASVAEGPMPVAAPALAVLPVPQGSGHVFPIVGGASFSNDWGGPRPGGRRHQGIDLFAKTGTPIVAISDGTLFKVGWNRVGGWRLWLRDKWGNEFYHAHLSAFAPAAQEGATVTAGTVIGFVGNTGDARNTPPHVHFEIHPGGGDPIPPFSYVSAWPTLAV
jgi:murein DD-endopeptidase MepM/ murein hydrolase activator NlpD